MAEIPMLFQGSMVQSILVKLKRRTSRDVTKRNTFWYGRQWPAELEKFDLKRAVLRQDGELYWCIMPDVSNSMASITPRAKAGDRIWVRETWGRYKGQVLFRATDEPPKSVRWRPGIHLERKHARLALPLTRVRFQRLQDITREEILAEGITYHDIPMGRGQPPVRVTRYSDEHALRAAFSHLWDSINGAGAWKRNPWVIVYEWESIEVLKS